MGQIEVGSTLTTYGPDGEIKSITKKPSYLILEDGTKKELTEEEAKAYGIGREQEE
jgi:hypothetical protein